VRYGDMEPEIFLEMYRGLLPEYCRISESPYIFPNRTDIPKELLEHNETGYLNKNEEYILGESKRGIADRITIGTGSLQQKRSDNNGETGDKGVGVLVYSDLGNPFNRYASVLFDLESDLVDRVILNANGKKMVPDIKGLEDAAIEYALPNLLGIINVYRNTHKVQFGVSRQDFLGEPIRKRKPGPLRSISKRRIQHNHF